MRRVAALVAVASLAGAACEKTSPSPTPGQAAASATTAPATPTPAEPAPPPPELDVAAQEKALGCPRAHKDACRILAEFASAGTWQAQMPSGEGAWVGRAVVVSGKLDSVESLVLGARRVPTSEVGPGDLPLKVALGPMPGDQSAATDKLVSALARGDTAPKSNAALAYAKSWRPASARAATKTTGSSLRLVSDASVYLRQTSAQKVLVVQIGAAAPGKVVAAGDASYAELWPVSW